jgi:hypothetical protein
MGINREHESVYASQSPESVRERVYASQSSESVREWVLVSRSSELILAVSPRSETPVQCSSVSGIREANSANVFIVNVACVAAVNLHSE